MSSTFDNIKRAYSLKTNLRILFVRDNVRWASLDGFRVLGIAWVILGHCFYSLQGAYGMEWWSETISSSPLHFQWIYNGDAAVDSFFMISAFLMANMLFRQYQTIDAIKPGLFYVSRLMRLTPAYFVAMFIYMQFQNTETKNVLINFFYLQNFSNDYSAYFLPFTWSLAIEEQFYLLLPPFLIFIFFRSDRPIVWLIGLFILSFVIRAIVVLTNDTISQSTFQEVAFDYKKFGEYFVVLYDNTYTRFGAFIPGIFVAYLYRFHSKKLEDFLKSDLALFLTWFFMALLLFFIFFPFLHKDYAINQTLTNLVHIFRKGLICMGMGWILLTALYENRLANRLHRFLSHKIFYSHGQLLYSMYLFHYLAVGFVMINLKANIDYYQIDIRDYFFTIMFLVFFASFILTSILSVITYLTLELPVMNIRPKASTSAEIAKAADKAEAEKKSN